MPYAYQINGHLGHREPPDPATVLAVPDGGQFPIRAAFHTAPENDQNDHFGTDVAGAQQRPGQGCSAALESENTEWGASRPQPSSSAEMPRS
jgi:hypothetical protein